MKNLLLFVAFVTSPFITLFLADYLLVGKYKAPTATMVEAKAKAEVVVTKPVPNPKAIKVVAKAKPKVAKPKLSRLEMMIEKLIPALGKVESENDDWAIGDENLALKAYGRFQARQPCVDDVNRILSTNYKAEDTLGNYQLSLLICRTYLKYWGGRLDNPTYEDLACLWNGGPRGKQVAKTAAYWTKVRKVL